MPSCPPWGPGRPVAPAYRRHHAVPVPDSVSWRLRAGHRLFALYVTGYSALWIVEESPRIDSSAHLVGLRLAFSVASLLTLAGLLWFGQVRCRQVRQTTAPVGAATDP